MQLRFLGGAGEVGRSAILVDDRLLLDYGTKPGTRPQYPLDGPAPEAVVVSHGHLDHAGAVPALLSGAARPPVHWTPPTADLARTLAEDTLKLHGGTYDCPFVENDVHRMTEVSETHGYREPFDAAGYEVTFYEAGHVPGSAHVLVDDGETRLLYTADFYAVPRDDGDGDGDATGTGTGTASADARTDSRGRPIRGQRLVRETTARPEADVVVTESTYSDVEHGDRGVLERSFVESLRTTVWEGGTVVVPAFAIGRTQEVLLICAAHDVDCYVDGMGTRVTETLLRHPAYVRDAEALRRAKAHARFVTGRDGQRRRIADRNTVIVTTSGMLSGGPAMTYVPAIRSNPTNTVALTGYQVEGTPGRELLETGRAAFDGRVLPVAAAVESYDFSAHADRHGLVSFLRAYEDVPILVQHGDRCGAFAAELRAGGFDATAPSLGETIEV
jgi:putative mRNA 3-end processing factor